MPQPCLLMQCESSPREEEIPPLFWGLDPMFLAFAKLYIKDVLEMKESEQVPGIYFYNGHPIRRVDIMGTVVSVREREAFYCYGVDDATGVINCLCWKKLSNTESSADPAALSTARELSVTSQLKKLQESIEQKTKVGIGDVIRVRGYVRMFREEREIRATIYYKVDDPVWNMQIARMFELPELYKKVYDQPFHNPALKEEEALNNKDTLDLAGLTSLLSEKVKEFLQEKKVQSFYQQELEMVESLQSLASQPVTHSTSSDQVELKNNTSGVSHSVFKNALQLLWERGLVFQRDAGSDKLYYVEVFFLLHTSDIGGRKLRLDPVSTVENWLQNRVTSKDKDLHQKIYQIIKEDCQRPNHVEKGCHLMHILNCVHLNLRWDLNTAVLKQVLELLEDQSDIVSTGDQYYTAF